MSMRCLCSLRPAIATAALLVTACVRPGASRSAIPTPSPSSPASGAGPHSVELLLDAELRSQACGGATSQYGITGLARMKVRDDPQSGPRARSELEYELVIENEHRLRLAGATLRMHGITGGPARVGEETVILWAGETSDKPRLRMRGIVALPKGASTAEFANALRERRSALQIRVSDQSGTAAGCGDLRN